MFSLPISAEAGQIGQIGHVLGLFSLDVAPDAWYYGAVTAAKELGLLDFASGGAGLER